MPQGVEVEVQVERWVTVPSAVGSSRGVWVQKHSDHGTIRLSVPGTDPVIVDVEQLRHALDLAEHPEAGS